MKMKKRTSFIFIIILSIFYLTTSLNVNAAVTASEQNLINYINNSRTINISLARSTISTNNTVIYVAKQLTTGETALKILGKAFFEVPTSMITPAKWASLGKNLTDDVDLWITVSGFIFANGSCSSSNKNAQEVVNLYAANPTVKDYNTAKRIFDLMKQSQIDGNGGRAIVMPIIKKYAELEPKFGAYKALTMVFLESAADSATSMFGKNIDQMKKVVKIYSATSNSTTVLEAIQTLSGYGDAATKTAADWDKLYATIVAVPKEDKNKLADGVYTIESKQGGNLNIYAGKDKDGTNACIWQKDNSKEQQFRISSIGLNKYKIYVLSSGNGYGRVLDVNRGTSYNSPLKYGLNIDIWKENDAPAQEWYITSVGDGYYKIELAALKDGVVTSAGSTNNSNVYLDKYTGTKGQQWKFVK
jgi:hypothetical protein